MEKQRQVTKVELGKISADPLSVQNLLYRAFGHLPRMRGIYTTVPGMVNQFGNLNEARVEYKGNEDPAEIQKNISAAQQKFQHSGLAPLVQAVSAGNPFDIINYLQNPAEYYQAKSMNAKPPLSASEARAFIVTAFERMKRLSGGRLTKDAEKAYVPFKGTAREQSPSTIAWRITSAMTA